MRTPKCFDDDRQFRGWLECREQCYDRDAHICEDCLPEYQERMVKVGRCEHPEVKFRVDKHGMVEGWGWK